MNIGVAILAGGQAQRLYGIAKGNIKIGVKQTIISRLLNQFKEIGLTEIIIAANDPEPYLQYQIPIITDHEQKQGPLAGIISSLHYFANKGYEKVVFVTSDLPNITHNELEVLKNNDFTYAKIQEQLHPLCVVVPTNKLNAIIQIFENGERKIINVWKKLEGKSLEFEDDNKFVNINTEREFKEYSRALIWVISGAGRGVGKTTLANNLCSILSDSIYAKYGHGKFKPHKQPNFFHNIEEVFSFIDKHSTLKKHIIVEANALMLTEIGDIKIFIDAIDSITHPRKDAGELKIAANIIISHSGNRIEGQKFLNNFTLSKIEQHNVLEALKITKLDLQGAYCS